MRIAIVCSGLLVLAGLLLLDRLHPTVLPVPPQDDVMIAGVTVINPGVERLRDHSIVMRDGTIAEVRPRRADDPEPMCSGCYAVPGLIDAHVHTPPRVAVGNQALFALLYLAHGVTTVRDLGASDGSVVDLAARLNDGELVGPRMFRCGPVLDGEPPSWPSAIVVDDAQAGSEIVDRLAAEGVDCIKVYNEVRRDAFDGIAAAAQRHGLPLVGHVPHAVGLRVVADFEAQHLTGVPYLSRPRPPPGWDLRDEDVLLLSTAEIEHAIGLALARRISFTPTLANFSLRLTASDPQRFPPGEVSAVLPRYWAPVWDLIAGHPSTPEAIERRLRAVPVLRAVTGRAHERGVHVLAGSDTIMPWVLPGESMHRELTELRQAFGSAEAALAAATTVNGRQIAAGEIGVIAPGARADVLITLDDPTKELAALRAWRVVYASGRRYDRATVDAWLESYRQHFRSGIYEAVMGSLVGWAAEAFQHASRGPDDHRG
jgi:cytosine/adenosine deaminase-related metal-dependent hydrolase